MGEGKTMGTYSLLVDFLLLKRKKGLKQFTKYLQQSFLGDGYMGLL